MCRKHPLEFLAELIPLCKGFVCGFIVMWAFHPVERAVDGIVA
jgi:hypothetical protein